MVREKGASVMTKPFEVRVLLTCTTGRLLTKRKGERDNGIGDLYELLGWMTDDSPMTHQLGRFSRECAPYLLRWFPELSKADERLPELDRLLKANEPEEGIEKWLASLQVRLPELKTSYEVPKILPETTMT